MKIETKEWKKMDYRRTCYNLSTAHGQTYMSIV